MVFSDADRRPWLCVGFGEQTGPLPDDRDITLENEPAEVAMWMDHHEYSTTVLGTEDISIFPGPYNDFTEQELRGEGGTPLGEAVQAAYNYISQVMADELVQDPQTAACRPYSTIILTDGQFGGINPVPEVDALYDDLGVESWVIGLAYFSDTLDHMAEVGGCHFDPDQPLDEFPYNGNGPDCANPAGHAFLADSEDSLSSILYQIVSGSILIEVCNEVDDDCDGEIDEGFELYCDLPNSDPVEHLCTDPGETECDGLDDNCNGEIDEGTWPPGPACGGCDPLVYAWCTDPDEGICQEGTEQCIPGTGWVCVGEIGPLPAEDCNSLDDDCDGETDEGVPSSGPCGTTDEGECTMGNWYCDTLLGEWACDAVFPSSEGSSCNNLDDDCDGDTDEGISQGCGGCDDILTWPWCVDPNEGMCQQGVQVCVGGAWGACNGEVEPAAEVCNGFDDDCDGVDDDSPIDVGGLCGGGPPGNENTGECQQGNEICVDGHLECAGDVGPAPEGLTCDGLDNDCDDLTDEGISQACCLGSVQRRRGSCARAVRQPRQRLRRHNRQQPDRRGRRLRGRPVGLRERGPVPGGSDRLRVRCDRVPG
jgi:hypothetical protein